MPVPSLERYEDASVLFRALAAPVRLAIIDLLATHHQLLVHEIVEAAGVSQALTSQHLRVLRHARLVTRVQRGRQVMYRLRDPELSSVVSSAVIYCDAQIQHSGIAPARRR